MRMNRRIWLARFKETLHSAYAGEFTRKGWADGYPAAMQPPIRTLRYTVLEILMYIQYIPVSARRAPCTSSHSTTVPRFPSLWGAIRFRTTQVYKAQFTRSKIT